MFVISFKLIPWDQMVNGGLPTSLKSQELVCGHAARSSTVAEEHVHVVKQADETELRENRKQVSSIFIPQNDVG